MKYFGIRNQNNKLICVASEETIEAVKDEARRIFKNDNLKICEISTEHLDKFIEEWADGAGVGTKLLCKEIHENRKS